MLADWRAVQRRRVSAVELSGLAGKPGNRIAIRISGRRRMELIGRGLIRSCKHREQNNRGGGRQSGHRIAFGRGFAAGIRKVMRVPQTGFVNVLVRCWSSIQVQMVVNVGTLSEVVIIQRPNDGQYCPE